MFFVISGLPFPISCGLARERFLYVNVMAGNDQFRCEIARFFAQFPLADSPVACGIIRVFLPAAESLSNDCSIWS